MRAATVLSSKEFDSKVEGLLSEDERAMLEFSLATNPTAHPVIPGTDGVRKARWARRGLGKTRRDSSDLLLRNQRGSDSVDFGIRREPEGEFEQ